MDHIEGLSPAIAIEQKTASHNPRSTVGTVTEIYDYMRVLYARVGTPHCPEHGTVLEAQTISQMVDHVLSLPEGSRLILLAPVVQARKGEHVHVLEELRAQGFVRARIDGEVVELDQPPKLDLRRKHVIEAVVDLSGQAIPGSGYFVMAESTFSLGTADYVTSLNFENSDNVTHLLVSGFSGADGDDLDTDDDGVSDGNEVDAGTDPDTSNGQLYGSLESR